MSFSGKSIKYRVGDSFDSCGLFTIAPSSDDIAIPVTIDGTTMYLIGVHPDNVDNYSLSSLTKVVNSITYTIASGAIKSKTLSIVHFGNKNTAVATVAQDIYDSLSNSISAGGHSDYVNITKTSYGACLTFNNIIEAHVENYCIIGAGGNGGKGGAAKSVQAGTSVTTVYGAGGGGGEAGDSISSDSITPITKVYCEYTSTLGYVRVIGYNESTAVINKTAKSGKNGTNAVNGTVGVGGSGTTNGTDGEDGYTTNIYLSTNQYTSNASAPYTGKGGTGGSGGIIWDTIYGHGGAGGNGSESTTTTSSGETGSGWYINLKVSYKYKK